ncbi:MAG TPA: Mur ligase family protein [Synergistales bacterium]|nr:Mur ligase family protein [Synergistales bacterium]HRV70914.1 Mur ligase family protein [Thermovirgaceae bacterium]
MKKEPPEYRLLVTGTRGKSTASRYLASAFGSIGLTCSTRITGTIPTVIDHTGSRKIIRSCPGHISEMRWWLENIPEGTSAIVAENSAVSTEMQSLPAKWLKPSLIIWTTLLPDHAEHWGPGVSGARRSLLEGVPEGSDVILGPQASRDKPLLSLLAAKRCSIITIMENEKNFVEQYKAIAVKALDILGLPGSSASFGNIAEDRHAFRTVITPGGGLIAWAFSSNDPDTAKNLFYSLGWKPEETVMLFNHRSDRPGRLISHFSFLNSLPWKAVWVTGDRTFLPPGIRFKQIHTAQKMDSLASLSGRVFGCGNVRGLPFPEEVEKS